MEPFRVKITPLSITMLLWSPAGGGGTAERDYTGGGDRAVCGCDSGEDDSGEDELSSSTRGRLRSDFDMKSLQNHSY